MHLAQHRRGFSPGLTQIVGPSHESGVGIGLAVLRLAPSERRVLAAAQETAWLLVQGALEVRIGPHRARWARASLFDEKPGCIHVPAGTEAEVSAWTEVELLRFTTASTARFLPSVHAPSEVRQEQRGRGWVGGACHRLVRTILDRATTDPAAELVLGEVVTPPGRWSSYPPHHHPQPELYHYRFSAPQGYGHAELGERVVKVRQYDTLLILPHHDHAQAAAPGYGMYYAWAIRHLPGAPYRGPTFTDEHRWVMHADVVPGPSRRTEEP